MSAHIETSMLLGEFLVPIDDEGQLLLPEEVVAALGKNLVVTRGFERNLLLLPKERFETLAVSLLERPFSKPEARMLRRRLFSAAKELKPDENGRIRLPKALQEFVAAKDGVVLAGMYQYAEIWSRDNWNPIIEAATADAGEAFWDDLGI